MGRQRGKGPREGDKGAGGPRFTPLPMVQSQNCGNEEQGAQAAHLGLVPLLGFGDVLSCYGLILSPDVSQGSSEIWFGHVHLYLYLLFLKLGLQLSDLLRGSLGLSLFLGLPRILFPSPRAQHHLHFHQEEDKEREEQEKREEDQGEKEGEEEKEDEEEKGEEDQGEEEDD